MKGMVRCKSLSLGGAGAYNLAAQEKHGKRLDRTSQLRKVRDADPIVHGSLDLRREYDQHVEGAKINASLRRPVLHFLIKMPDQILGDDAPRPFAALKDKDDRKRLMMKQAVDFINENHGGNAVFAARVDRDEQGEMIIDIFAAPVYEKITKTGKSSGLWMSPTKYGKDLALQHQDEIKRRHPERKEGRENENLTGPRQVGIALQAEFAVFFERENGVKLERKHKAKGSPDRLETEAFKRIEAARVDAVERAQVSAGRIMWDAEQRAVSMTTAAKEIDRDIRLVLDEDRSRLHQDRADLEEDRADLERREDVIERKMNIIQSLQGVITRAMSTIRDTLGLTVGAGLQGDVEAITERIDQLSAEDARPEADRGDGPSL